MKFILAEKLKMEQIFDESGKVAPVTVLKAGPCFVAQVKSVEKDGYNGVQISFRPKKKDSRSRVGHFAKMKLSQFKSFYAAREFVLDEEEVQGLELGQEISVKVFEPGEKVFLQATSKGKGFQGVVKRHGFSGGPASHGHKDQLRMPGSVGATGPAKVFKGVRMGGRTGNQTTTIRNLEVIKIDEENNLIYLKGGVPGAKGALVRIYCEGKMELAAFQPEKVKTEDHEKKADAPKEIEKQSVIAEESKAEEPVAAKTEEKKEEPAAQEKENKTGDKKQPEQAESKNKTEAKSEK